MSDVHVGQECARARSRQPGRRVDLAIEAGLVLVILGISLILWRNEWFRGNPARTLPATGVGDLGDASSEIWYLAWLPKALLHGLNPFGSQFMFAHRGGVNVLSNPSSLGVAAIVSPITLLFGPIASFNTLLVACPVANGLAFFRAARRFTGFLPGLIVASIAFAFNPVVFIQQPGGRFMLTLLVFPPLILAIAYESLVAKRWSARAVGLALGAALVCQFFVGTEVLAITFVALAVGLVAALLLRPRSSNVPWRRLATVAAWALGVAVPILAYPLWFVLFGPQHLTRPAWALVAVSRYTPQAIVDLGAHLPAYAGPFSGAIVGWAILAVLGASAWRWGRLGWTLAIVGAFSWLCTLGNPPHAGASAWLHPAQWLDKLPLVGAISSPRYQIVVDLCICALLCISADAWWDLLTKRTSTIAHHLQQRRVLAASAATVVTLVLLAAIMPVAAKYSAPKSAVLTEPNWFSVRSHSVPEDAAVLMFPEYLGMIWEATESLPFHDVRGYAVDPVPMNAFDTFLSGADFLSISGPLDRAALAQAQASMRLRGVALVVVQFKAPVGAKVVAAITAILGRAPRVMAGAMVWHVTARSIPRGVSASTARAFVDCSHAYTLSLQAARCVLLKSDERKAGNRATSRHR